MEITPYKIAERFIGIKEVEGRASNPNILAMLKLDGDWPQDDAVPWCSAFVNYCCWLLRLPRSKSLRARSWLNVGLGVSIDEALIGFDVVILKRGGQNQPGPNVIHAPGHVGFFSGHNNYNAHKYGSKISILGGNQANMVSVNEYHRHRILGVRRINGPA